MTAEAINKLSDAQRERLMTYQALINTLPQDFERAEYKHTLRGYLTCLADLGVITNREMAGLYSYYAH